MIRKVGDVATRLLFFNVLLPCGLCLCRLGADPDDQSAYEDAQSQEDCGRKDTPSKLFRSTLRTMPLVPPEELIPWLVRHDLLTIPEGGEFERATEAYWQHCAAYGLPHCEDKPGTSCVPVWLWGDDCIYNKLGAKLVVIAMGLVLKDYDSSDSKDLVWPLCCYQLDSWLKIRELEEAFPSKFTNATSYEAPKHPRTTALASRHCRRSCAKPAGSSAETM